MIKSESLPLKATSLKGISKMYGLGKSTLRKAINEGRLRALRIGRRTLIRIVDADAFIASGQEIPPAPGGAPSARGRKQPKRLRTSGDGQ
jgi:excisionase family DNA binding protein